MRAASADRKRPWNAPAPRKAAETKQTVKLTVPTVRSTDRTLASLHSRLSAVVNKIMDYVNVSCELLTSHHISPSGGVTQDRLLEELTQEKGKWELYMFHELSIEEDLLRKLTPPSLETVKGDLGNAVGDFKRISDLVADTQNHVTLALRKAGRREDPSLNSKIWQVFTTLNQNIYESFFRHRRAEDPKPRLLNNEVEDLQKQIRILETQVNDGKTALRNKEIELEHMEKKMVRDVELFKRVEYAAGLEQDLKRTEDIAARLKSDVAARDAAIRELERRLKPSTKRAVEMSPRDHYSQSNSFRNLKEQLDKKTGTPETKEFHLRSDLESVIKERDSLATREDPISRFSDESRSEEQQMHGRGPYKRPSSATPGESRGGLSAKELELELNREREKSRSFFNALKRKEKECDELYESLGSNGQVNEDLIILKKEKEELTKALTEVRRQEQKQLVEVNKFANAIKALERDKAKDEQDRSKLLREIDALKQVQDRYKDLNQNNEDLHRQLKLTIEDKQKLLKILNQTKVELTKTADGFMKLEKERELLNQKIDFLTQEKEMLMRKISSRQNTLQEEFSRVKTACQEEIKKVEILMETKLEDINKSLIEKEDKLEASKTTFETKLREYEEIIRQASDQTNLCEAELRDEKMRNEEAETRAQASEAYSDQLRSEIDTLQLECEKWETDYESLQSKSSHELTSKVQELARLTDTMRSLVLQNKEKDSEIQQLRYDRETLERENSDLTSDIASLKDQILALEQQYLNAIQDSNTQVEKLQFQLSEEEQARIQAESSVAGTKETIQAKEQLVEYVKTQLIDARSGMTQSEVQVKRLVAQLEAKDALIQQQETDLKDFTWHLQENDTLLKEKSEAVIHMEEDLESREDRIRVLLIALESHEKEVISLTETNADLSSRLSNLQSDAFFHAGEDAKLSETQKVEIAELRKETEKLKMSLSDAAEKSEKEGKAHVSALNSQIETLRQILQEKSSEIADLQERVSMEDGTVEELHKLLGSADAQLSAVEKAQEEQLRLLDKKTKELDQLILEKRGLESTCLEKETSIATLLEENCTLRSLNNTSATITKESLDQKTLELEQLTLEKRELETTCARHATALETLLEENEELKHSGNITAEKLAQKTLEFEHLILDQHKLESSNVQYAQTLSDLREENAALRNSIATSTLGIKEQLTLAEQRCAAQTQELAQLSQKLKSEEENRREIEKRISSISEEYQQRLKQEVENAKNPYAEKLTEQIAIKEAELTEAKREITALSSEIQELHERLEGYLEKDRDWKRDQRESKETIEKLDKENREKTLSLQSEDELIENLQQKVVELTHEIGVLTTELTTANESLQHTTEEVTSLKSHLQLGSRKTEEQESLIQSLKEALTSAQFRSSSETDESQRRSDLVQLSNLETKVSELTSEIADLNLRLEIAQKNEGEAQIDLKRKIADLEQLQREIRDVTAERDSYLATSVAVEEVQENKELPALQETANQIEELRRNLTERQLEFSEISEKLNARLGESEQRRTQAEALAQATLQELEQFHESKSQETAVVSKELESLRIKSKMEKEVHTQVLEEYTRLQKMYDDLKETSEKMKQQLQHQAALLKQSKESIDRHKLKGSAETLSRKIEDLTALVEDKDKQLLQFESKFVSMLKELESRRTELAECQTMLKSANEALGQKEQVQPGETNSHMEQSLTILLQENELASQRIIQLEEKLHQTEAFNTALQIEKDGILADIAKRELEPEIIMHLKLTLSAKDAEITELLQALAKHSPNPRESFPEEELLKSCLEELNSSLESQFRKLASKVLDLDIKTGRLLTSAEMLRQIYGRKRKELAGNVSEIGELLSIFQDEVEVKQKRLGKTVEGLDEKTSSVLAKVSELLRKYGDLKNTSKSTLVSLFTAANQETLQKFALMERKLIEVDTKTLSVIGHLSDRNSELEQETKALRKEIQREIHSSQGLETTLKAMDSQIQDHFTGLEARFAQVDFRANSLLGKCVRLVTNLSKRNSALDREIVALRKTQEEQIVSICSVSTQDMDRKFQVVDSKLSEIGSRTVSLLSNSLRYIADLSNRNSVLLKRIKTLEEMSGEENEVVKEATTPEETEALLRQNEELTNRLGKTQSRLAESESKVQRLQHLLDDHSRGTDTFALVDMMDSAAAAGESEFRKVNMSVADVCLKLETLATTVLHLFPRYQETTKRNLQNFQSSLIPDMNRLEQECIKRVQELEDRLGRLKTRAHDKIRELRSEINFLKGLNEAKGQGNVRGSEDTRRPTDGSQHLDDSVEFVSFEPIHRRGSSVNASLEDIKQAFGSMKVCKRVKYEGQLWCLTMTHEDEPEFYWWKEQELPRAEIASVWPEVEEESLKSQLDSLTFEHKEVLIELSNLRKDRNFVQDWLTRQGFDMSLLTLEAALTDLHSDKVLPSPRPRSSLTPISVDSSYDVTILREGESSQFTPKLGRDMMVLPGSSDPELDSLLDTISRLTTENQEQAEVIETYTRETEKEKEALVSALTELKNASQPNDQKKLPATTLLMSLLEHRLQTRKK